jgi:hypothetical protein
VECYGTVGFLKAGLLFAERIITVSPTYAREIQSPEWGMGLDGLLRSRADRPRHPQRHRHQRLARNRPIGPSPTRWAIWRAAGPTRAFQA